MNLFNALPFEMQQYIYTFDGRYKQAMDKTLVLIKEWGRSDGGARFSGNKRIPNNRAYKTWIKPSPNFDKELGRRVIQFQRHLTPKGSINRSGRAKCMWGQWVNTSGNLVFMDIFGCFDVSKWSKERGFTVTIAFSGMEPKVHKTHTKVSKLDLLDPVVQKKLRTCNDPVNAFRAYGLSPNGTKPVPNHWFDKVDIDGRTYIIIKGNLMTLDGNVLGKVSTR